MVFDSQEPWDMCGHVLRPACFSLRQLALACVEYEGIWALRICCWNCRLKLAVPTTNSDFYIESISCLCRPVSRLTLVNQHGSRSELVVRLVCRRFYLMLSVFFIFFFVSIRNSKTLKTDFHCLPGPGWEEGEPHERAPHSQALPEHLCRRERRQTDPCC